MGSAGFEFTVGEFFKDLDKLNLVMVVVRI